MPVFHGWSHISISVTDLAESERFFTDVLGLHVVDHVEHEGWSAVIAGDGKGMVLEAQCHEARTGERFDPRRPGLDHIGLRVDTRAELEEWQEHFARLGVDHTPIVTMPYGEVLTFRHPDGHQFEMFLVERARAERAGFV